MAHWMSRASIIPESESVGIRMRWRNISSLFLFLLTLYLSKQGTKIINVTYRSKTRKSETSRWLLPKLRRSCRLIPSSFSGFSCFPFHFCYVNFNDAGSIFSLTVFSYCVCSKTYCSFCVRVKQLFANLGVTYKLLELDVERECLFVAFPFR